VHFELTVEQIAEICHQANKTYCALVLDDHSQVDWSQAADWQKESAIKGVTFRLEYPEVGPESQHNNWLNDKEVDGWVYGPEKDAVKKTHPCILPYSELPVEQQLKDSLFAAIVNSLSRH
jgi:hypothetical protein